MSKNYFRNFVIFASAAVLFFGFFILGASGAASPRVGNVIFREDNQIDTGQKPQRKGRTENEGDLEETGRRAEPQGVQDIINNIVHLLGGNSQKGNVNLHTANEPQYHPAAPVAPQNRLPFNRINNRGPPKQNELPFEAIPLEPANYNKRPQNSPFAPNGIPLPVQIVPQRGPFGPGPLRPQGPMTIPLRPPVRITPPPLPDMFPFGVPINASQDAPAPAEPQRPPPPPPPPSTTLKSTTETQQEQHEETGESDDYYPSNDTEIHESNVEVPDEEIIVPHDRHPSEDHVDVSHDDTVLSHDDTVVSHDDTIVSHDDVSGDSNHVSNDNDTPHDNTWVSNDDIDAHDNSGVSNDNTNASHSDNESEVKHDNESHTGVSSDGHPSGSDVVPDQINEGDIKNEETHYEYEDEPSPVAPLETTKIVQEPINLVNFTAPDSSVVQPSMDDISVASVIVPVAVSTSYSSVFPVESSQSVYQPVSSNPVFSVIESSNTPTPPLQGRPGMVFSDEERPYRGGQGVASGGEPSMFWINPNQMQGDIFELTVNAAQNFGGGGGGATQTFKIPAVGRPVVEPVNIEDLRGEDGILTVARPGDEFVSIDGKRTYFNLHPDGMQTVGPSIYPAAPVAQPSSLQFYQPKPPQEQAIPVYEPKQQNLVSTVVRPRPGMAEAVSRPIPVVPVQQKTTTKPVVPESQPSGVGTFEVEEPPVKPSAGLTKPKPSAPKEDGHLRIDTCQEGDDSTCDVGETCRSDNFGASCICRSGWGRKNPRLSCIEVVTLALSLRLDRLSGKQLTFSKDLENPLSSKYKELTKEAKMAIDSLLTYSTLLPIYISSDVVGYGPHNGRLATNITVQFETSSDTTSPSFRNKLNRQLTDAIEEFRNRLGSSQLFVEGTQSPVLSIQDVNECQNEDLNDCSANASCKNNAGSFECACKAGFIDKKDVDPRMVGRFCIPAICSNDYCNKRGDCRIEGPKKVCYCKGSFGGAQCDIDTEVVGVAAGASVTAILIIIITLVGLCWWSRRWRRDQDSDLGMPRYAGRAPGQIALALPYAPQQYGRPQMPPQQYYMPAFIHPPLDYELSSMHSYDVLSQISTMRRPIAPTMSLPPQLEGRRRVSEEDGLVGAMRTWYRRLSKRQHAAPSSLAGMGVPSYPNPYMEHQINRPKRTGSVISHGKSRRAPPPPTQPPPPLIEFSEDRNSLSSGLYDSIDDKKSLHT